MDWRYVKASLFFSPLLILAIVGEIYVRHIPNAARDKHTFLTHHAVDVDVLILGSSHTYYGIAPHILSKHAYSAAQVSQTLRYDDWILHHYDFQNLKCVIQPISDFTFYENLEGGKEWYLANRYRLYMDCEIHSRLSVYNWEITAFPVFIEKLKGLWQTPRLRWNSYGQGLEYTLANRQKKWDNGASRAANNRYTDFGNAEENMSHLQNIANFCHQHRVRLLLITTPLRPSYRQSQDARQVADTRERVQLFLRSNPEVRYLDFSTSPQFTASDFYDSDHLNTVGAEKLSLLLANEL